MSNVKLKSSGEPYVPRTDEHICLALYDENGEFALSEYGTLCICFDYDSSFFEKLKHGKGEIYAEFISLDGQELTIDQATIQELVQKAQNTKYYSIYIAQFEY